MATEPLKIAYGGDMMLFIGSTWKKPIAFSTNAKLEVKANTRDIASKDSGYWKDKLSGRLEWSASTDALYTEPLSAYAKTGTITTADDSDQVVGVGTVFTTQLAVGEIIRKADGTILGTIESIEDNTHLTLTANAASDNSGIAFNAGDANAFDDLYALLVARSPVTLTFSAVLGKAPGWAVNTVKKNFVGSAIITGLSVNAPDGETTTYSMTLEGSGALTIAP